MADTAITETEPESLDQAFDCWVFRLEEGEREARKHATDALPSWLGELRYDDPWSDRYRFHRIIEGLRWMQTDLLTRANAEGWTTSRLYEHLIRLLEVAQRL